MPIDRLVGVRVSDEAGYRTYRARMTPLLEAQGGRFVVDVRVEEVLRAPDQANFNRLFTIRFPNQAAMEAFFDSPAYQAIRAEHFVPSVSETATLGLYAVVE